MNRRRLLSDPFSNSDLPNLFENLSLQPQNNSDIEMEAMIAQLTDQLTDL